MNSSSNIIVNNDSSNVVYRSSVRVYLQTSSPARSVYDNRAHVSRAFPKDRQREINKTNRTLMRKIEAMSSRPTHIEPMVTRPAAKGCAAEDLAQRTKRINKENKRMAVRLSNVKSTIGRE